MTSWKTYTLKELSKGRGEYGIGAPAVPFDKEKYTYLRITDINDDGTLNTLGMMSVDAEGADKYLLEKNDIVFARTGNSTGRSYFYDGRDGELVYAGFLIRFRLDETKVNPKILKYYTHSKPYYDWVKSFDTGGTRGNINAKTYGDMPIYLPPRHIQDRIAGILGAIDDKIENNRRINTNLELQAQALYKQWFVDNRSDDWKTLILDDVATLSAGGDKPPVCSDKKTPDCNIPIYSNGIDNEGLYGYTNRPRITENSITISARGTIGYVCLRTEPYVPIVRLISVIPTHDNMSAYFLYLWALTQNISGTGTTQQQLTVPAFRTTQIVVPSQEILIRFNKVVKPIFDCIKQNKVENETLATLRDTLLPKLMNGEIKL